MRFLWIFVLLAFALGGCASFLHFRDPSAQAVTCGIAESEVLVIQGASVICGPFAPACLAALEAIFGDACMSAAASGKTQEQAHRAGLDAVHRRSGEMRASLVRAGVHVSPDAGVAP